MPAAAGGGSEFRCEADGEVSSEATFWTTVRADGGVRTVGVDVEPDAGWAHAGAGGVVGGRPVNVPLVVFGAAMARVMCSYFATRDYYANALYVSVCATADGVRIELHVPGRALRFARVPRSIEVPRSAVERVFRCGPFGGTALVVLAPERGLPPMMVSWRVVRLLGLTGRATRARRGWCRQVVTDGELPR